MPVEARFRLQRFVDGLLAEAIAQGAGVTLELSETAPVLEYRISGPQGTCPIEIGFYQGYIAVSLGVSGVIGEFGHGKSASLVIEAEQWIRNIWQLVLAGQLEELHYDRGQKTLAKEIKSAGSSGEVIAASWPRWWQKLRATQVRSISYRPYFQPLPDEPPNQK